MTKSEIFDDALLRQLEANLKMAKGKSAKTPSEKKEKRMNIEQAELAFKHRKKELKLEAKSIQQELQPKPLYRNNSRNRYQPSIGLSVSTNQF